MRRSLLLLGLMMCCGTAVTFGENRYGGDPFNADAATAWQPNRFLEPAPENAVPDRAATWHPNHFSKSDPQGSKPNSQAGVRAARAGAGPSGSRTNGSGPQYAPRGVLVNRSTAREPIGDAPIKHGAPVTVAGNSRPAGLGSRTAPVPVPAKAQSAVPDPRTAPMPVPRTPRVAGLNLRTGSGPVLTNARPAGLNLLSGRLSRYPWKLNIVTTIFWVGEYASVRNPVPNRQSAWDKHWSANYGGYDNPNPWARRNYMPVRFVPHQNPFYFALPYNDIERHHTKREARYVIPWFRRTFVRDGQTVLKDRWIAIRHGNRICYAQWEDCGPFRTDHWQYVFGRERPRPNLNQGAGLDVSPAVRDYLGLANKDVCDWKFVEAFEVPPGPWTFYGRNRPFAIASRAERLHRGQNVGGHQLVGEREILGRDAGHGRFKRDG